MADFNELWNNIVNPGQVNPLALGHAAATQPESLIPLMVAAGVPPPNRGPGFDEVPFPSSPGGTQASQPTGAPLDLSPPNPGAAGTGAGSQKMNDLSKVLQGVKAPEPPKMQAMSPLKPDVPQARAMPSGNPAIVALLNEIIGKATSPTVRLGQTIK